MQRPDPSEYDPYYALYIDQVEDGDILETLVKSVAETVMLLRDVPPEWMRHRYAPEKWSLGEVLGHVIDAERVFGYRALVFARGDSSPLPSMEQDDYVTAGNFGQRTLGDLTEEFAHQRASLAVLFRSFDDETWMRRGTASGFEFTVRAVAYILAGHAHHHAAVVRERYL